MAEAREIRIKRLRIRCWRRGMKEMDLLLGPFADGPLARFDDAALDAFEAMLVEDDQDLYAWLSGAATPEARHAQMLALVAAHHGIAFGKG